MYDVLAIMVIYTLRYNIKGSVATCIAWECNTITEIGTQYNRPLQRTQFKLQKFCFPIRIVQIHFEAPIHRTPKLNLYCPQSVLYSEVKSTLLLLFCLYTVILY